jgi:hypothetical protein
MQTMTAAVANAALNQLLVILYRSFPMYLADASPWTHTGDEQAKQVLEHIVTDERYYAGRITELLLDRRSLAGFGEYPMSFTDTHDLALDYLIVELIYYQKQDIAATERCVEALSRDPEGRAIAEEVLGNARGHLESLEELKKRTINDK